MTDLGDLDGRLNLDLIEQVQDLQRQLAASEAQREQLAALVQGRSEGDKALKKILEYMPRVGELSTNASAIAGQMMQQKPLWESIDQSLKAIAKALQPKETP